MSEAENVMEDGERVSKGNQRREYTTGGDPEPPQPHVGATAVGIFIFVLILYSAYQQMWQFVLYNTSLLVVLALGSKALN